MEPMDTLTKPGIMAKLRNRRGFSLIEMAIVLVIIGIIIGAIIKGQDLMFNSRAKQLVATANSWKISAFAYMDRNGNFPGDSGKDGTIASGPTSSTEIASGGTAISEITSALSNAPANPVLIGGQSYWFYFGYVNGDNGPRNGIVVCPTVDCLTALSPDSVEMYKALDTALDGTADAGTGQFRALKTTSSSNITTGGSANGRANGVVINPTLENSTAAGSNKVWLTDHFGGFWAFDKQF